MKNRTFSACKEVMVSIHGEGEVVGHDEFFSALKDMDQREFSCRCTTNTSILSFSKESLMKIKMHINRLPNSLSPLFKDNQ